MQVSRITGIIGFTGLGLRQELSALPPEAEALNGSPFSLVSSLHALLPSPHLGGGGV